MNKKNSVSKDKLNDVCRSLKELDFRTKEDREWIRQFNDTPLIIRREILGLLEKEQTKSIIKGMHSLDKNISVPFLGTFGVKESWKDFILLCRDNPNTPVEELVQIIKAKHKERLIKKKQGLKLLTIKNETSP